MPRWLQVILHAVLLSSNTALAIHGVIPPAAVIGISALQAGLSYVAQEYNTDGTHQGTPFQGK